MRSRWKASPPRGSPNWKRSSAMTRKPIPCSAEPARYAVALKGARRAGHCRGGMEKHAEQGSALRDPGMTTANEIVSFWRDSGPDRWFGGGDAFDAECRTRFLEAHLLAARREFEHWLAEAEGALALVLLLDQIPRNIFRGSGHAFATDPLARHYAARALAAGFDLQCDPALRLFFYMPFEHSEDAAEQARSVELFAALGDDNLMGYATAHREVIARFGRFPHRNRALGRDNTPDEQAWLDAGGGF